MPQKGVTLADESENEKLVADEAATDGLFTNNTIDELEDRRASRDENPTTKATVYTVPTRLVYRIGGAITIWYLSSFAVIFLNKYILSYQHVDPYYLTTVQMVCMAVAGYARLKFMYRWSLSSVKRRTNLTDVIPDPERDYRVPNVFSNKSNTVVGILRVLTILFGLVSLNYVAVSFTETVKSSGPLFTVVIAACLLGERTSCTVLLTLIPIMAGLAICSASELSFNMLGFSAALLTNVAECVQFVLSKMILCPAVITLEPTPINSSRSDVVKKGSFRTLVNYLRVGNITRASVSPLQFEYASAVAACFVQVPLFIMFVMLSNSDGGAGRPSAVVSAQEAAVLTARKYNASVVSDPSMPPLLSSLPSSMFGKYVSREVLFTSILSGLCWHVQSLVSWELMSHVSPVTHAVINVVKRVLTIWLSVIIFGNIVTPGAWLGTAMLVAGVFCYNSAKARER